MAWFADKKMVLKHHPDKKGEMNAKDAKAADEYFNRIQTGLSPYSMHATCMPYHLTTPSYHCLDYLSLPTAHQPSATSPL
jgi:hypothetical protein